MRLTHPPELPAPGGGVVGLDWAAAAWAVGSFPRVDEKPDYMKRRLWDALAKLPADPRRAAVMIYRCGYLALQDYVKRLPEAQFYARFIILDAAWTVVAWSAEDAASQKDVLAEAFVRRALDGGIIDDRLRRALTDGKDAVCRLYEEPPFDPAVEVLRLERRSAYSLDATFWSQTAQPRVTIAAENFTAVVLQQRGTFTPEEWRRALDGNPVRVVERYARLKRLARLEPATERILDCLSAGVRRWYWRLGVDGRAVGSKEQKELFFAVWALGGPDDASFLWERYDSFNRRVSAHLDFFNGRLCAALTQAEELELCAQITTFLVENEARTDDVRLKPQFLKHLLGCRKKCRLHHFKKLFPN